MLARWLGLPAIAAAITAASGCGGTGTSTANSAVGSQLAIYSSLPLQGPNAAVSQQIVNGEKLALSDVGGHVGRFKIGYVSLDDSSPTSGQSSPSATATDAKTAAQDPATIAYLGEFDSAATALSVTLTNAAGIPQVSPSSPYVGLTQALDAGQDEPARFYLSGHHTFARLQPGDPVEAAAQVQLMRSLGIHSVYVLDDRDPFQAPLAQILASDATQAGIAVAGTDHLSVTAGANYSGEAEKIIESKAQAVLFSGRGGAAAAALWSQLHAAAPHLLLLGGSATLDETFTANLGSAGAATYMTTPLLALGLYPPAAQRVLRLYRRDFGSEANAYALYGYEAMSVVLSAIRRAGSRGNDRAVVLAQLLSTRNRDSVLGRYSIEPDGEPTFSRYGVDRVLGGQPVFYRAIAVKR